MPTRTTRRGLTGGTRRLATLAAATAVLGTSLAVAPAAGAVQRTGVDAAAPQCNTNRYYYDLRNKVTNMKVADIRFDVKRCVEDGELSPTTTTGLRASTTTAGDFFYQAEVSPGPPSADKTGPDLHVLRQEADFKTCLIIDAGPVCYHKDLRFYAEVKPGGVSHHAANVIGGDWKLVETRPYG